MAQNWFPPPLKPLQRLQVTDGLLMNAERWQLAHQYHRQKANYHYQSLHQGGIVYGLGVSVIQAPESVRSQYRDGRWLQIQPGMAIDDQGNFIIVPQPVEFRLASENYQEQPLTVYLVLRYVDPETLQRRQSGEIVTETFRVDEKSQPPTENDVELCRVILSGVMEGREPTVILANATDVLSPRNYQLDLRYRRIVRSRPGMEISAAYLQHPQNPIDISQKCDRFNDFLSHIETIYPSLSATHPLHTVSLYATEEEIQNIDYDCLYFPCSATFELSLTEQATLKRYLESGGVLLVEPDVRETSLVELLEINRDLQKAIAATDSDPEVVQTHQELITEYNAIQSAITAEIPKVFPQWEELARELGQTLESLSTFSHPLQKQPFLFSSLPIIEQQLTHIALGGGIVILLGHLSLAWGYNPDYIFSRDVIRNAQELGINILYFAKLKKQLTQWQQTHTINPEQLTVDPDSFTQVNKEQLSMSNE